jgi:hypothetical protein
MTEVEHAPVAMAVDEPLPSFDVVDERPFPFAKGNINPGGFEERRFSRRNMLCE